MITTPYTPRPFRAGEAVVIDYETTGLQHDPGAHVFAVTFTWCNDGYTEIYRGLDRIAEFWKSNCEAIVHNLAFEWWFTIEHGFEVKKGKILHDTMIQHQYLNNLSRKHGLDFCAMQYAGWNKEWAEADSQVEKAFKIYGSYDKIPVALMNKYQRIDGERTALLHRIQWPEVKPKDEYWNEIELIKTTVEMQRRGILVDCEAADRLIRRMKLYLAFNSFRVKSKYGNINLNSPAQVKKALGVEGSVDNEALQSIDHPLVDCVLLARSYTKGVASVESYKKAAETDTFLHPNIHTNSDVTGREASSKPNMQNISKEIKAGAKYTVAARCCFRPRPGYFFLLADYAGIEMRLGCQATGSKRLLDLCAQDFDFHAAFALSMYGDIYTNPEKVIKFVFGKDVTSYTSKESIDLYEQAKKALRSRAKMGRFALFYGAGVLTLSKALGIDLLSANRGYARDKKAFPEFSSLMQACSYEARNLGGVTTFFGRFLRVDPFRPYAATDYLIQGSAAALFKHAQNDLFRYLSEKGFDMHLLLPVHDELVIEVHKKYEKDIVSICKQIEKIMVTYKEITVPLKVEFSKCDISWDKKEEIKL